MKTTTIMAAMSVAFLMAASASAVDVASQYAKCRERYTNPFMGATVILACTATEGKLSECKIAEAPTPAAGFDKAALCVAQVLPMGTRTGPVTVPIKFNAP